MTRLQLAAPLFVPGNRPERFEKAAASGADAIIIDLEDAVAADDKEAARAALRAGFGQPGRRAQPEDRQGDKRGDGEGRRRH